MSKIYKSTADLIGNTPLFELTNIEKELGLEAKIVAKLEYFNPAGSVKDRIAKEIIEQAEKAGRLSQVLFLLNQLLVILVSVLHLLLHLRVTELF